MDDAFSTSSSHTHHRIHLPRGRTKARDKDNSRPPTSADPTLAEQYRRGLRVHLDGTASSHSSQTRLLRSGSPTPSIASSLSNHPPLSPSDDVDRKGKGSLWTKMGQKFVKKDKEKGGAETSANRRLRPKTSEPMLNSASNSSSHVMAKRGSGSNEHGNPRMLDYATQEQLQAFRNSERARLGVGRRGVSDSGKDPRKRSNKSGNLEAPTAFHIDTSFSDQNEWLVPGGSTNLPEAISWEPPESWASLGMETQQDVAPDEEQDAEASEDNQTVSLSIAIGRSICLTIFSTVFGYSVPIRHLQLSPASCRHL